MAVIDAQVHAYERNHPGRPWAGLLHGPPEVTADDMVTAMDAVGVDGALLVSPWTMYRFDAGYALEAYASHPGRFALVKPIDPSDAGAPEVIAEWAATPGAVGVRLMIASGFSNPPDEDALDRVIAAAVAHQLPVNVLCWGRLDVMGRLAERRPEAQLIVDHLGLVQPFEPPAPADPFRRLAEVLELARHPGIAIKITGACTLSHQSFPFADVAEPLARIFDAYGIDRCLWGTDWTRATGILTYAQGVESFAANQPLVGGLGPHERSLLMGGSLERIYRWSPTLSRT